MLLAKFASHRALGNAIEALSHYDLDLPQGTITDGLKRISPLLEPVYEAILARNAESFYRQADETRWPDSSSRKAKRASAGGFGRS